MPASQFLDQLIKDGASYTKDSVFIIGKDTFERYVVRDIYLKSDTIYSAAIGLHELKNKTKVYIERLQISNSKNIQLFKDYSDCDEWSKRYKMEAKEYFRETEK